MTQEKTWNVANRLHSQKDSDNPEVNHVIAGADEIYDDAKGAKQSDINAQTDAAIADRYTKSETYSKEQLDALITTPDANYVTVATFADLPQAGEANTIYRVSSYDGTQVDASKYALYAWNGATYQLLAVRSAVGEVFDVSEYNTGATYETLAAALAAVPASVQRGGMSIKFILRSNTGTEEEPVYHDEYVQYLLKNTAWSATTSDWESTDGNNTIHINDAQQLTDAQKAQAMANMGVQKELALGAVYDVSAKNPTAGPNNDGKFESLSALLSDANLNTLIPTAVRKGGMSIKFVCSADNKYVQYRLMSDSFNTTPANWQGVDEEPTAGSNNLVKSGSVYDIQEDLKHTNDAINRTKIVLPNGSEKSKIPTTTTIISGGAYKAYDYDIEGIDHIIEIYSNIVSPDSGFPTAVLWALYATIPHDEANPIAYGPLLSTGKQNSECDLSLYPNKKILRVTFYTYPDHGDIPTTEVSYYSTDFVKRSEMSDVLRTTDVVDSLDSELTDKPLSAKQGKVLDEKIDDVSAYDLEDIVLSPTSTGGSNIPKSDGTLVSGGSLRRRNDYDVSGIDKVITISTAAPRVTEISKFVDVVYYILKDGNSNVLYAGADIHNVNPSPATLDLSLYPNAKTLQITVDGTTKSSSVSYKENVAKFIPTEDVVDNLNSTSTNKPLSANQGRILNNKIENYTQEVLLAMPPVIELVGRSLDSSVYGNRLQIYYRDIVGAVDPFKNQMKPICAGGQIKHRYFGYDAKSVTTENVAFKLQILNDNGSVVTEKNTTIKVIAPPTSPASNKNILLLGSSTLGTGTVAKEVHRRLCETSGSNTTYRDNPKGLGLTNISFVGRRYGSVYNEVLQESIGGAGFSKKYAIDSGNQIRFYVASGNVELGDVYSDGVTNYTVTEDNVATVGGGNFLTAQATDPVSASGTLTKVSGGGDSTIAYTSYYKESGNPFWDRTLSTPGLNFQKYADNYCNGSIDMIVSLMTGNDLSEVNGNIELLLTNYVKPFVRKYHQEFPNGKFIFGIQPPYSIYGDSALTYDMKLWTIKYALALYDMAEDNEFSSYFSIAHTLQLFDNDNMFPLSGQPVANRLPNVYEKETINGTHPTGAGGQFQIGDDEAGCLTLADGLYYAICAAL